MINRTSLDYKWTLGQLKKGLDPNAIEKLAGDIQRKEQQEELLGRILGSLSTVPLWHSTSLLSDEDVIRAFTQAGRTVVETGLHRRD